MPVRAAADDRRGRTPFAVAVGVAALLAVALRAPFFGTPLGLDEGGLAFVAEHWMRHGTSVYGDQWLDRPPLLVLVVGVAVAAGGAAGMRALGALAAVALVAVVAALARAVGGDRAGRHAAVAAAILASSIALQAVYTPAELLAAVPATVSVLCLVTALRTGRLETLVAAGALATGAALVKQSFLDAGFAGVVFLAACAVSRHTSFRRAWIVAWVAGAVLPLVGVLAASAAGYVDGRALPYALVGFRIAALRTLAGTGPPLLDRFVHLAVPAIASGLAIAIALVPLALRRLRHEAVIAATLAAWLGAGVAGVAGGGTYWAHYLIEIVPAAAVLYGVAVAGAPAAVRVAVPAVAVVLACGAALAATAYVARDQPHGPERAVGSYIRVHARPRDTQFVLYARANVLFYGGLPTPFPYDWSLMDRVQPGARGALYALLASSRRPTWLVPWQNDDAWRLDSGDRVDVLLRRNYRPVATVDGHVILHRDEPSAMHVPATGQEPFRDTRHAGPGCPRPCSPPSRRRSSTASPATAYTPCSRSWPSMRSFRPAASSRCSWRARSPAARSQRTTSPSSATRFRPVP
jgi:hypothetical protein